MGNGEEWSVWSIWSLWSFGLSGRLVYLVYLVISSIRTGHGQWGRMVCLVSLVIWSLWSFGLSGLFSQRKKGEKDGLSGHLGKESEKGEKNKKT
jgi:hypothetical protein